jgi:hypothetical protein
LDGSAVSVKVGCSCRHCEWALLMIVAGEPNGSIQ